jgi:FMN-dependent NADH-azoreductase
MKLLHIDSSIPNDNSVTRQLTRTVVEQWKQKHPHIEVMYHDLAVEAPAHLTAEILGAGSVPEEQRSDLQRAEIEASETLLREFTEADVMVLGAPMYNFSIPSQLNSWLDRVLVAGRTFNYTEQGPVGLLTGKQAVIVSARGGIYSAGAASVMDHQESYLRAALGFVGIKDITVVRAEGVNINQKMREQAIAAAQGQVRNVLKEAA